MADRIETSKLTAFVLTGLPDVAQCTKIVAYALLVPGSEEPGDTTRQGHVHAQVIRRNRR